MSKTLAFLNGCLVPTTEARIPFTDAGFVQGTTVAEQLRTFGGALFQLDGHLERLGSSLQIVGVEPPFTPQQLRDAAEELVSHNRATLDPNDDMGLSIFVTPGVYPTFASTSAPPTVGMHTYPLPFHLWADLYRTGQRLVIPKTRQISPDNWPLHLKCRSRMHYYLAEREARTVDPAARALLLDDQGYISETTTSNLIAVFDSSQFVSPPLAQILPGISLQFAGDLVAQLTDRLETANSLRHGATGNDVTWEYRAMRLHDLRQASEALLSATSSCLLPVATMDGQAVGSSVPGPAFRRLIGAWSDHVGLDIIEQAKRFATARRRA